MEEVLFDPQTSGGLLIAEASRRKRRGIKTGGTSGTIVGEIISKAEKEIYVGVL